MRRNRCLAVLSVIAIATGIGIYSCGGGGDGGGGGGVVGYSLDNTNMLQASSDGVAVTSFFPPFTTVSFQLVSLITSGGNPMTGPIRPSAIIPIPLPGFCVSGSADFTWDDRDNDGLLSTGDVASLTMADCLLPDVPVSGGVTFDFVDVTGIDNVTADVAADIEIVDVETQHFVANFRLQVSSADGILFDALYGGTDRSDFLSLSLDGVEAFRFGCFDVWQWFSVPSMDTNYGLRTRGVANIQGKIMTLGSYFVPDVALFFQPVVGFPDPVPDVGTQTLLSFDARPSAGYSACSVVGSSGNLNTNGNELLLTATGGGNVTIELFDSSHTLLDTEFTTWDVIL